MLKNSGAAIASAATFAVAGAMCVGSAASAFADVATPGTNSESLGSPANIGGQSWTVSNLKQSSDAIPYQAHGTLWEATATDEAVQGGATPLISNLNATSPGGQTYRVLYQVATPQGVNPAGLAQGQKTTGKVYFDVTGDNPNKVVYREAGGQDLATWTQPIAPTGGTGGHATTSGSGGQSTATPGNKPATPAGNPAPAGSQGTAIPTGSQGTPAPGATGSIPPAAGTPVAPPAAGTPVAPPAAGTPVAPAAASPAEGTAPGAPAPATAPGAPAPAPGSEAPAQAPGSPQPPTVSQGTPASAGTPANSAPAPAEGQPAAPGGTAPPAGSQGAQGQSQGTETP